MSVITRKCIVTLSYRFNSFPAFFFFSSTSLKVSSTNFYLRNPKKADSILSFLHKTGFSGPQIDQMINKSSRILNVNPKTLNAKLKIFHNNGFPISDTIYIVSKNPWIVNQCSEIRIMTSIASLKFVLGSTEAICRVLKRLSWFLKNDLDKTLIPNFEYLMNSSGLSCSIVANYIIKYPRTFLLRPEILADGARRVNEMGLEWTPKMYFQAVCIVSSLSPATLQLKKNLFIGLGFSDSDVLRMFNRYPVLFHCSEKKIKRNIEVLLSSGRIDRSSLVKNTELLLYSLEKRIKPRLKVIDALEERGLLLKELSLSTIMTRSNHFFLESYVLFNLKGLGVSSEILKAKLMIFHENGFSTLGIINIIFKNPWILNRCSENRIRTSIASLKSVLGSTEAVFKVLRRFSWFLKTDLEKTMIPNFEYLKNHLGLSCSNVANHMLSFPKTFLVCPETLAEGARRVDEMGLQWNPKMYLRAVSAACSLSLTVLQNIFLGFGLSDCDVLMMFSRCPLVFSTSEKNLKETMEALLSSGRIDSSSLVVRHTNLLLYSVEKRIKPRLEVVNALEERGLLLNKLSLSTIMTMSNKKFLERYVISNSKTLGRSFVTIITNRLDWRTGAV